VMVHARKGQATGLDLEMEKLCIPFS
jgi:hypothetical protein